MEDVRGTENLFLLRVDGSGRGLTLSAGDGFTDTGGAGADIEIQGTAASSSAIWIAGTVGGTSGTWMTGVGTEGVAAVRPVDGCRNEFPRLLRDVVSLEELIAASSSFSFHAGSKLTI